MKHEVFQETFLLTTTSAAQGYSLERLETTIAAHLPSAVRAVADYVLVGDALGAIRDGRLYPQATFERYLRERWNLSRARGYQLLAAAGVVSTAVEAGLPPPKSERVARELTPLLNEPHELVATWREALRIHSDKTPTHQQVAQLRKRRKNSTPEAEPIDDLNERTSQGAQLIYSVAELAAEVSSLPVGFFDSFVVVHFTDGEAGDGLDNAELDRLIDFLFALRECG
jgi:hypothetical protein